ncbi:hypothetical protein J22TS1_47420 [Siminovitchia terrae]|uniref:hypothetical protein n=1 Tax=Siminovitchia terrae TaxID=1914933 RepID=UPI001B14632B|nr:hypothetical protein [Siminovitchia terrae]GIN93691.1 hypothetical protein J22TS1_47420 [Siminovitchia terrae]
MIENKISTSYKNDIQKFKIFCDETGRKEDEQSFLYYMYNSIENERVKKTTWEKRVVAIRKYLTVTLGIHFDDSIRSKIGTMRTMYHEDDKMDLIQVKGKSPGYAPYNFRKTQVLSMHAAGADLSTIAKQTGHKSLETIDKHYLEVSDPTVDKYL